MHGSPTKKRAPAEELVQTGFCILEDVFAEPEIRALCAEMERCETLRPAEAAQSLLKTSDLVARISQLPALLLPITEYLGTDATPFSAFFLDKSAERNWQMPWHQNLRIPVAISAHAGIMLENGVPHIIPEAEYLKNVVILRISLDEQNRENGGLEFVPGSHRHGIFSDTAVAEAGQNAEINCPTLQPGSVFLFQALLVHRSRSSALAQRRRVLQIEYAPAPPSGFRWFGF